MNSLPNLSSFAEDVEILRERVGLSASVLRFEDDPKFCARVASLGIHLEVGTINDQLADFLYDLDTGLPLSRASLRSEIVEYRGFVGVRIYSMGTHRIDLRLKGGRELLHPTFSFHPDGSIRELIFFPESIAKIVRLQGVELVLVREWALNTIFGGFDRSRRFYETNAWELVHNDTLRYSGLLRDRRIALLGTHDLTAHVAGLERDAVDELQVRGEETHRKLRTYYGAVKKPSVYSLVLPYAAGVLLDDLAQVGNYGAESRRIVFSEIMELIERRATDPKDDRLLAKFPSAYESLIALARLPDASRVRREVSALGQKLVEELRSFSTFSH